MRRYFLILFFSCFFFVVHGDDALVRYLCVEYADDDFWRTPLNQVDSILQNEQEISVWKDGKAVFTQLPYDIQWMYIQDAYRDTIWLEISMAEPNTGTVNGSGFYLNDTTLTLQVVPAPHYLFSHWSDGNTDNPRQITVTQTTTLLAHVTYLEHAVDLGLPSKTIWANCNLGATQSYEYGEYFVWKTDGLLTEEEKKQWLWSDQWQLPTLVSMEELRDYCTWEFINMEGVNGMRLTGPNGNAIFLPAAGYYKNNEPTLQKLWGTYWSNQRDENDNTKATILFFDHIGKGIALFEADFARPIRPILIP